MNNLNSRIASDDNRKLRIALSAGVSAFAISLFASPAFAQDTAGTATTAAAGRGAGRQSGGRHRRRGDHRHRHPRQPSSARWTSSATASGVVDAIVAEDIGKFPDTNLAESLQRIPGVVDQPRQRRRLRRSRSAASAAQFNLVTLNGRQMPTSNVSHRRRRPERRLRARPPAARSTSRTSRRKASASSRSTRPAARRCRRAASARRSTSSPAVRSTPANPASPAASAPRRSTTLEQLEDFNVTPEVLGPAQLGRSDEERFGVIAVRRLPEARKRGRQRHVERLEHPHLPRLHQPGQRLRATRRPPSPTRRPIPTTLVAVPNDSRYHYSESERERHQRPARAAIPADGNAHPDGRRLLRARTSLQRGAQPTRPTGSTGRSTRSRFDGNPRGRDRRFSSRRTLNGVKDIGFEQQFRATRTRCSPSASTPDWEIVDGLTLNLDGHTSRGEERA